MHSKQKYIVLLIFLRATT